MITKRNIVSNHEYILVYAKSDKFKFYGISRDEKEFTNPDNDPRGKWKRQYLQRLGKGHPIRSVKNKLNGKEYFFETPYTQQKINKWVEENKIIFPINNNKYPARKEFLSEYKHKKQLVSSLGLYPTKSSTQELIQLFDGKKIFNTPKPTNLIKHLINSSTKNNDIVMDFFAGSGTTAEAVIKSNIEDEANRSFIIIQNSEPPNIKCEYKTIFDITIDRCRRVINKLNIKNGFKVYKLI